MGTQTLQQPSSKPRPALRLEGGNQPSLTQKLESQTSRHNDKPTAQ